MTAQGPAWITVTGTTLPILIKGLGHADFFPDNSFHHDLFSSGTEGLDLDIDSCRKIQFLQFFDGLVVVFADIEQSLVDPHFKMLTGFFIHMGRTKNTKTMNLSGKRNGAVMLAPVLLALMTISLTD